MNAALLAVVGLIAGAHAEKAAHADAIGAGLQPKPRRAHEITAEEQFHKTYDDTHEFVTNGWGAGVSQQAMLNAVGVATEQAVVGAGMVRGQVKVAAKNMPYDNPTMLEHQRRKANQQIALGTEANEDKRIAEANGKVWEGSNAGAVNPGANAVFDSYTQIKRNLQDTGLPFELDPKALDPLAAVQVNKPDGKAPKATNLQDSGMDAKAQRVKTLASAKQLMKLMNVAAMADERAKQLIEEASNARAEADLVVTPIKDRSDKLARYHRAKTLQNAQSLDMQAALANMKARKLNTMVQELKSSAKGAKV